MKKLKNWFCKQDKSAKVSIVISILLGFCIAIAVFIWLDKEPAKPTDYALMEEQIAAIQENPSEIFKEDCNINVNNDIITVEFENDECKLIAQYNQDFNLLLIEKEDKYTNVWIALFVALSIWYLDSMIINLTIIEIKFNNKYIKKKK